MADNITPSEQAKQIARDIAEQIEETGAPQIYKIAQITEYCGEAFVRDLLAQTLEIQAQGGMWMAQVKRKRSPGGVFFYLAKGQMSKDTQRVLNLRPQDRKKRTAAYKQRQAALRAAIPDDIRPQYKKMKQVVAQLQSRLDIAREQGTPEEELAADQATLADIQRQIDAIEKSHLKQRQKNET